MITAKNATAINNSGLGVNRYNLVMTPEVFKVFYSSLYEDKELAVLRELVSNGDDGHTAAGITDVPVVIHLPTKLVPELTIVDKGIGMSLDDIQNNYTTYGKSTKRDSNDEIGGFGYGAKSPFAIAQSFTVETTKNGITTVFVNFIDEDGPNYTVISSEQTGNPSGTTVRVPVGDEQMQRQLAKKATEGLFALWKTQPDIKNAGSVSPVKYKVINREDTHLEIEVNAYASNAPLTHVASGPFMYKIPVNMMERLMNNADYRFLDSMYQVSRAVQSDESRVFILPNFNVGELELSPSRERIEDTKENEQRITARVANIVAKFKVPELTVQEHADKAHALVTKYGVKVSDLIGSIKNDHVITFKNQDEAIKEILPAGWEPTVARLSAVLLQTNISTHHWVNGQDVPAGLQPLLVASHNIATSRVTNKPVVQDMTCLYNISSMITIMTGRRFDTEAYLSKVVIKELDIFTRAGRTYRAGRDFTDGQTIIVVNEKMKARVSRCLAHAVTGWQNPMAVFTDDVKGVVATLEKTSVVLKRKFNYVYEDEIKTLLKTIPKATRTTTSGTTVDRRVGRQFNLRRSEYSYILESELPAVLASSKSILFVLSDASRVDYMMDNRIKTLIEMFKLNILYVTKTDYEAKKYISKIYAPAKAANQLEIIECDSYEMADKLTSYLATQPNGKAIFEELVATTVLDKKSFETLYPTATVKYPAANYCSSRSYFGNYLHNTAKASVSLRCKWSGYLHLSDITELSQVMDASELTVIKTALQAFTKTQIKF